jgi:hypothetical protein
MSESQTCHACGVAVGWGLGDAQLRHERAKQELRAALGGWCERCEARIFCHVGIDTHEATVRRLLAKVALTRSRDSS